MTTVTHCCGLRGSVIDSRESTEDLWRRRRECGYCGHRWSTYEMQVGGEYARGMRLEWLAPEEQRMVLALRAVKA